MELSSMVSINISTPTFIHLRLHSAYSLSEGAIHIEELPALCREQAMPAVAVTDSNNLFGAMEYSGTLSANGIQPIVGCQLKVEIPLEEERIQKQSGNLVFLVQNHVGYLNLLKLISRAYMDPDNVNDPHVTVHDLNKYHKGLIVLSGGPEGPVGSLLLNGKSDSARKLCIQLNNTFSGRFYLELMRHGLEQETITEELFLNFAYDLNIPLVATNEVFFSTRDMYEAHDALICIAGGQRISETNRRRLTVHHYFKSAKEMSVLFEDIPEAISNTVVIAKRCAYKVEQIDPILPPFDNGDGVSETEMLRTIAKAGLEDRIQNQVHTTDLDEKANKKLALPYRERLEYELDTIVNMGFHGYFLIVADFIRWAKEHNIPVGPGRGSGAGSVVAWSLNITDLDPLRWGLLFERFLNPERVSMPDFDIDFCQDRRDEVIQYVQNKYGRDHVAQIITFGKLQAKAALRDVGRVLGMTYGDVDRICKLIPNDPANPVTLSQAIESEKELERLINEDSDVSHLVHIAKQLEGLYRHASTHAAGVVIGDRPLNQLIPVYQDQRSSMPVTGFSMKFVEAAGLVKFDFLGLKTLTVLAMAENLVRARGDGSDVNVAKIPLDDPKTFKMIGHGDTTGVFQLESTGMRDVLRNLKPDTFEDIIAVVALYRPGPMDNIPSYINRKHGREEIDYLYPTLESILSETNGIIIYQEQVMQIAQELAGYTLGSADLLRRAMGKKIKAEMRQQRSIFIEGAIDKGVPEQKASEIFNLVDRFAGYGFNKSHAAAYALVAYQTAFMKANYPVEFLAACMTLDLGNTDKLNIFKQELDRLGLNLLKPDINFSQPVFAVEDFCHKNGSIRYALGAIKNVGTAAMERLVAERKENGKFKNLGDFINRLDTTQINKRQILYLIQAGALDDLGHNRRQLSDNIEMLMRHASVAQQAREDDQMGLFRGENVPTQTLKLPNINDWPPMKRLRDEFDAIGFYLSAHPLDAYQSLLKKLRTQLVAEVLSDRKEGIFALAGTVIGKKERTSAKGNRYAFMQLSDPSGVYEVTIFSDTLNQSREYIEVGEPLLIKASLTFEGDAPRFTVKSLDPLEESALNTTCGMRILLNDETNLTSLKEVLSQEKGKGDVEITTRITSEELEKNVTILLADKCAVTPALLMAVRSLHGILDVNEL